MDTEKALEVLAKALEENKLFQYKPYPWQIDFHAAGKENPERLLSAGNRCGKTFSGGTEAAYHATGKYPAWWKGKRFDKPTLGWVGGVSNEALREIVQKELLGGMGSDLGKGAIPKTHIGKTLVKPGVPGVFEIVKIRHVSGGESTIVFKSYEQGWRKWQGASPDWIWLDEEPDDYKIYTECRTRIITSHGIIWTTFTPLMGLTDLYQHFQLGKAGTYFKNVTWDDAPHLSKEQKDQAWASFPEHERETRIKGIPMRGEGRVFTVNEDDVRCKGFQVPDYFHQIIGIDFGWDHPAATVKVAHDADNDVIYVVDAHKKRHMAALEHCEQVKRMGTGINTPVAWPHDGLKTRGEMGKGAQLVEEYKKHGIYLLSMSARHDNKKGGAQSREKTVMEIYERMRTGRFKVFDHLSEWFEEFRNYHRKDGVIVDKMDDLLSATFYAVMMKRFAVPKYIRQESNFSESII